MKQNILKFIYQYPNTKTVASYSPFGQHIHLETISEDRFKIAFFDKQNIQNLEEMKVILHEMKHWLDQSSTLYGQLEIIEIFNAYNAILTDNHELFWHGRHIIKKFHRHKVGTYFQTFDRNPVNSKWQFALSCGLRPNNEGYFVDSDPIVFARFVDESDNFIARVPIEISSLLEVSAMHEEFQFAFERILAQNEDQQEEKMKLLIDSTQSWVFNSELALYSAVAHITANLLKISDVQTSLKVSSLVANICLNIPDSLFSKLKIPEHLAPWGEKNKFLIENRNRGYLFVLLIHNYVESGGNLSELNAESVLATSGLPTQDKIQLEISNQISDKRNRHEKGLFTPIMDAFLQRGMKIMEERKIGGENYKISEDLRFEDTPSFFYADSDMSSINVAQALRTCIERKTLAPIAGKDAWLKVAQLFEYKCDEFSEVCGL